MKSAHAAPLKYFSSLVAILMVVFGVSGLAAAEEFVSSTLESEFRTNGIGLTRDELVELGAYVARVAEAEARNTCGAPSGFK